MSSDLATFASEEPSSITEGTISLSQIAARKTSVSWVEALACIQQICDAVIASGNGPLSESSIHLHQSGAVSIEATGEVTPEEAVRFVGDLLGTWLEGTPHPMALDTILLATADSPPLYASVAELAAALKPDERPDRAQLVRAVYQRAGGAQAASLEPNLELRTENPEPRTEHREPSTENREPASFRRSQSRASSISLEGASTSILFGRGRPPGIDAPFGESPARRSLKDLSGNAWQRVIAAFQAVAERLRPALQTLFARLRAFPERLRPLAKPLAVAAVAVVALAALGVSGWMLITTLMRPSPTTTTQATPPQAEAPVARVTEARPVPPSNSTAPPRAPAAPAPARANSAAPAKATATPTAPQAVSAPVAATSQGAGTFVERALSAIAPAPPPRRTTSIVLESDRSRRSTAPPQSARAASPSSARSSAPSASPSVQSPSESPSAIELQAAAPPLPATSAVNVEPPAAAVASPAAVAPKWPEPPPPAVVYSLADADVIPPVQTYPRYVEALERERPNATELQIVIGENGLVESAMLAHYPVDMRQAVSGTLLLGAAKAWRFQPATKDGQPVKYRRIVWFSNQ